MRPLGSASAVLRRPQISRLEKPTERLLHLLGNVNLSLANALLKFYRRDVDELDVVCTFEKRIGHRFRNPDTRDLGDYVVETLDVLNGDRRVDVDARVEDLLDVLPPLSVDGALDVGMRQFVDKDQRGRRSMIAGTSSSDTNEPRYSIRLSGMCSSPWISCSVSLRPWVST